MGRFGAILLLVAFIIQGEVMMIFAKEANVYWREYKGTVPSDAISPGSGVYIGQGIVNCGLVAGTLYPARRTLVSEGPSGKVEVKSNIKVLCSTVPNTLKWEFVNVNQLGNDVLENCVSGGFEDGSLLYIGKIFHEGEWKIGKVFPPTSQHKGLRVWWNSGENYSVTDFQILMVA